MICKPIKPKSARARVATKRRTPAMVELWFVSLLNAQRANVVDIQKTGKEYPENQDFLSHWNLKLPDLNEVSACLRCIMT